MVVVLVFPFAAVTWRHTSSLNLLRVEFAQKELKGVENYAGARQISAALAQLGEAARQTADSLHQSASAIDQLSGASQGLKAGVERV